MKPTEEPGRIVASTDRAASRRCAMMAGMIDRRPASPLVGDDQPHRALPAKTMMLPQNTGTATWAGVQPSSFCR